MYVKRLLNFHPLYKCQLLLSLLCPPQVPKQPAQHTWRRAQVVVPEIRSGHHIDNNKVLMTIPIYLTLQGSGSPLCAVLSPPRYRRWDRWAGSSPGNDDISNHISHRTKAPSGKVRKKMVRGKLAAFQTDLGGRDACCSV